MNDLFPLFVQRNPFRSALATIIACAVCAEIVLRMVPHSGAAFLATFMTVLALAAASVPIFAIRD